MIGSGIFFNTPEKTDEPFVKILKKAQKSEKELAEEYNKYVKIYKKHISDLDALDDYIVEDNYNFDSFRKSFEMIESDLNDKKNPLLLNNYSDVPTNNFSDDIIEYHLLQQIKYLLEHNYSEEERELIKLVSIRNVKSKPEFKVFSVENKSTEYLPLFHTKFQLDYPKMKVIFDQVIKYITGITEKIKIQSPSLKSPPKTPNVNPFQKIKSPKSIKKKTLSLSKKSISKESPSPILSPTPKRKTKTKTIKKKIEDIVLPTNNDTLPVVQIKMPKKISKE
jgi:hypothetical protein